MFIFIHKTRQKTAEIIFKKNIQKFGNLWFLIMCGYPDDPRQPFLIVVFEALNCPQC